MELLNFICPNQFQAQPWNHFAVIPNVNFSEKSKLYWEKSLEMKDTKESLL